MVDCFIFLFLHSQSSSSSFKSSPLNSLYSNSIRWTQVLPVERCSLKYRHWLLPQLNFSSCCFILAQQLLQTLLCATAGFFVSGCNYQRLLIADCDDITANVIIADPSTDSADVTAADPSCCLLIADVIVANPSTDYADVIFS
ncbi:hypothetical protein F511_32343 [Dorcoceras hygrometricum]|uniref:Uncharacterized protein n=1 Tax=Dorcoceras hygrometricum TaxID=472368 RepID=A0A2Z7DIB4_9LAMI|nr:hypothetical protein F511_32343 [Dorcoceras hygrometricum]